MISPDAYVEDMYDDVEFQVFETSSFQELDNMSNLQSIDPYVDLNNGICQSMI